MKNDFIYSFVDKVLHILHWPLSAQSLFIAVFSIILPQDIKPTFTTLNSGTIVCLNKGHTVVSNVEIEYRRHFM